MRQIIFIATHLGAGSNYLRSTLNSHKRIDCFSTQSVYDGYDTLKTLVSRTHKNNNASALFVDELLYNFSFSCKELIPHCKWIFFLRNAGESLIDILREHSEYTKETAKLYYCFRLRGLYEYFRRSNGIVVTWDDLEKGNTAQIERYLDLKDRLIPTPLPARDDQVLIEEDCESCYRKYLAKMVRAV